MATRAKAREDIRRLLGDPRKVDRELQRFRTSARVLSSRHPRLIEKYPKQWVAVYEGKVRARAKTFDSLMAQIDKKKLPRGHVVVRHVDRTQRTMIL